MTAMQFTADSLKHLLNIRAQKVHQGLTWRLLGHTCCILMTPFYCSWFALNFLPV